MIYQILLLVNILLTVIGQLLLKDGMNRYAKFGVRELPKLLANIPVILGITLYGTSLLLWLVIISKLELSYAYPMISLNYFFITLSSKIFFKEHVSRKRWISIAVIVLGVILVSLS